jgi:hypothetical protein
MSALVQQIIEMITVGVKSVIDQIVALVFSIINLFPTTAA